MNTRRFSGSPEFEQPQRTVEDAPLGLRAEFAGLIFDLAERLEAMDREPTAHQLYLTIAQRLGIHDPANQPMNGVRLRGQQYLVECDWRRFFDLVESLLTTFPRQDHRAYREAINGLLAGNGIAWDLTEGGKLERVVPPPIAIEIQQTIDVLRQPGLEPARAVFDAAAAAFNDRPRRDRDAAANAFDALESVGKIRLQNQNGTFHDVLSVVRRQQRMNTDVLAIFEGVNQLRHRHLGHGMASPFVLGPNEVDFVYITCAAGIRLFARL